MNTQTKGDLAELRVASAIRRQGYTILIPFTESEQYDLGVDTGDRFIKVQVKYAKLQDNGTVKVSCLGTNSSKTGNNKTFYTEDQIDGIAAFCGDLEQCFWIPFSAMNKYSLTLSEDGEHPFDEHSIENL